MLKYLQMLGKYSFRTLILIFSIFFGQAECYAVDLPDQDGSGDKSITSQESLKGPDTPPNEEVSAPNSPSSPDPKESGLQPPVSHSITPDKKKINSEIETVNSLRADGLNPEDSNKLNIFKNNLIKLLKQEAPHKQSMKKETIIKEKRNIIEEIKKIYLKQLKVEIPVEIPMESNLAQSSKTAFNNLFELWIPIYNLNSLIPPISKDYVNPLQESIDHMRKINTLQSRMIHQDLKQKISFLRLKKAGLTQLVYKLQELLLNTFKSEQPNKFDKLMKIFISLKEMRGLLLDTVREIGETEREQQLRSSAEKQKQDEAAESESALRRAVKGLEDARGAEATILGGQHESCFVPVEDLPASILLISRPSELGLIFTDGWVGHSQPPSSVLAPTTTPDDNEPAEASEPEPMKPQVSNRGAFRKLQPQPQAPDSQRPNGPARQAW